MGVTLIQSRVQLLDPALIGQNSFTRCDRDEKNLSTRNHHDEKVDLNKESKLPNLIEPCYLNLCILAPLFVLFLVSQTLERSQTLTCQSTIVLHGRTAVLRRIEGELISVSNRAVLSVKSGTQSYKCILCGWLWSKQLTQRAAAVRCSWWAPVTHRGEGKTPITFQVEQLNRARVGLTSEFFVQ